MRGNGHAELGRLVAPDRVRRSVYGDPDIFEMEMANILHRVWLYCRHETQVPASPEQTTGEGVPSIFHEDRDLMMVPMKRITLQRVDLVNGQGPYDYVLQAWV